nr:extracellular solute-binding protein [Lactococcus petauri]
MNKDIFEKAGIDQASIPKSYEELVKAALEVKVGKK